MVDPHHVHTSRDHFEVDAERCVDYNSLDLAADKIRCCNWLTLSGRDCRKAYWAAEVGDESCRWVDNYCHYQLQPTLEVFGRPGWVHLAGSVEVDNMVELGCASVVGANTRLANTVDSGIDG